MFNIGDVVQHERSGQRGQVTGYGHQIVNDVYLSTLRVRILTAENHQWQTIEDVYSAWTSVKAANIEHSATPFSAIRARNDFSMTSGGEYGYSKTASAD